MLAEAISIGSNLLSGLFGQSQANKQAKQQAALQREFAQNAIQWKVDDAKKAGVHPLYALGAQTTSYAPVSTGDSLTPALRSAGQDLSRAVHAASPESTRAAAASSAMTALSLERGKLENELLRTQIASQAAKISQNANPPMPTAGDRYLIDGQSGSGLVDTSPLKRQASAPGATHQEAAAIPDVGFSKTRTGYAPAMSKDLMDRQEEDFIGSIMWNVRNRLLPSIGFNTSPPAMDAGPDKQWWYNPLKQEYTTIRRLKPPYGRGR